MKSPRDVIGTISNGYRGAGIVFICGDEVLMQLRRHPPVWSFVGGGFDRRKDHDLLDTALREFFEETGVRLSRENVISKPIHSLGFWRFRWNLYLYFSNVRISTSDAPARYSHEYQKYRYVNLYRYKDELKSEVHNKTFLFVPYQMRLIRKYIRRNNLNI